METINKQIEIIGLVISPGVTIGNVCHYQSGSSEQTAIYKIPIFQIDSELNRFQLALTESKKDISLLIKKIENSLGKNESKIFESHLMLLEDDKLISKIIDKVKNENINIEFAVKSIFEGFEETFNNMKDEYLKERKFDFIELKKRILNHLSGEKGKFLCKHQCLSFQKKGRIILTKELIPSMINLLENENISGFITQFGGKNSHAAIIARSIGIPYISGIDFIDKIECETPVIIDGITNKVIFNPTNKTINQYNDLININTATKFNVINQQKTIKSLNKNQIMLYANIINENDISIMNKYNLSGAGLVRTEFLFMKNKNFPSEHEQFLIYSNIINKANNKDITFRLFDFGGDKKIPSLEFSNEENPLLGLRGIRFLLQNKRILYAQIKAILKCCNLGKIKILYPMISRIEELLEINDIIKTVSKEIETIDKFEIGMMFEVPSVLIEPKKFINNVDFVSIGTNDLIQYLFGVDRNNQSISHLFNQDNSTLYKLLKKTVHEVKKQNKSISICGEIDFNSKFLENIIKLGINKISISPISAPKILEKISQIKTHTKKFHVSRETKK